MARCTDWSKRWKKLNESKEKGTYFRVSTLQEMGWAWVRAAASSWQQASRHIITLRSRDLVWRLCGTVDISLEMEFATEEIPIRCAQSLSNHRDNIRDPKTKKIEKHRSENIQLILFLFCYILGKICLKERWGRGQGDINLYLIHEKPSWKTLSRSWKRFHSILMRRTSVAWAT